LIYFRDSAFLRDPAGNKHYKKSGLTLRSEINILKRVNINNLRQRMAMFLLLFIFLLPLASFLFLKAGVS
jgi:hypothetical protein